MSHRLVAGGGACRSVDDYWLLRWLLKVRVAVAIS